ITSLIKTSPDAQVARRRASRAGDSCRAGVCLIVAAGGCRGGLGIGGRGVGRAVTAVRAEALAADGGTAALAAVGDVEAAALEDDGRGREYALGYGATARARLPRRRVKAFVQLVLVVATGALVFVSRHCRVSLPWEDLIRHQASWVCRKSSGFGRILASNF